MRTGKLKVKRYPARSPAKGLALLLCGVLLGAGAWAAFRGETPLALPWVNSTPAPFPQIADTARAEMTLTLPGQSWYALQLGALDTAREAQALAEGFRSRGAAGYVFMKDGYQVLAAAYETRTEAQKVQVQPKNQHQVEAKTVEILRPQVTFRLSGQKAQLSALEDALTNLDQLARRLGSLSVALDQGETGGDQARSALRSESATLSALREKLLSLFPGAAHPAVSALDQIMAELIPALDGAAGTAAQTRLGAQVKYCQLMCVCRLAAFAENPAGE